MWWPSGGASRRGRFGVAAVAALAIGMTSYPAASAGSGSSPPAHIIFTISSSRIHESSDLYNSGVHPGLVYTTNDSGDGPYVYVLDYSGHLVGTTTLSGVDPVDVEALGGAPDGSLVVADIGDNHATRPSVQLYRIPQPTAGDHTVTPTHVTLTYADGPHNAESVLYDATSGRVFVVSKQLSAQVYVTPPNVFSLGSATLEPVASAPSYATDATFLPGRDFVIIRTYPRAYVYRYPSWAPLRSFDLPNQKQGESVTGITRGSIWVGSEGVNSPVWWVPVKPPVGGPAHGGPTASAEPTFPTPGATPTTQGSDAGSGGWRTVATLSGSAGLLAVVLGAVVLRRPRRRSAQ